jgi:hypothetical protein
MDFAVPRSIARLQYAAARLPFALFDERVVARYWEPDAPVRVGLERWLGSLDLIAGRFLGDDEISRRGLALMRLTGDPAQAGSAMDAPLQPASSGQAQPDLQAGERPPEILPAGARPPEILPAGARPPEILPAGGDAPEMSDRVAAYREQDNPQQVRQAAGGHVTTGNAPSAAGEAPIRDAAGAAGQPGTPGTPAAEAGTVDVTFTLPADVHAGTVALCGEFNDWSAEDARLERGSDGSWRAIVPLEPGRSYRYRYLLDGQRWENDRQADRYVPNALGSTDSVVVVE